MSPIKRIQRKQLRLEADTSGKIQNLTKGAQTGVWCSVLALMHFL